MKIKTKVVIVVGLAALIGGIGYYFWKKASVTEPIVTKNDLPNISKGEGVRETKGSYGEAANLKKLK
jgi:hypothetical protein